MNSTGACRFAAVCAKRRGIRVFVAGLLFCLTSLAVDCGAGLSAQEKIDRFKQLDREAESAIEQKRPAEAVQLYEQAVCLVPNSARGFYGLGIAHAAAGDFVHARESFRAADRLQPTTGMPLVMQVRVNFSLQDMDALKSNLREAAERFPHDASLHTTLARFLAERNLFVLAVAEAMRAQQGSGDWNTQLQLAALENSVGAYQDSIRNALAVEQNYNVAPAARGTAAGIVGLSYESLHQKDSAIRYLQEAIELDPARDNSSMALADLYEQSQQYLEAIRVLQEARTHEPGSATILLALGADLIRAERYKEGIALIQELLQKAPDTAEAYISLADAARKTGDATQEVAALCNLTRYKPDYPMVHVLLARAMLNQQAPDYPKVLAELRQAAEVNPADPDVFFLRGKVYVALDKYDEALLALRRSIELRPLEPSPYYQLARLYQKLGKTEMAREQFERVRYLESAGVK